MLLAAALLLAGHAVQARTSPADPQAPRYLIEGVEIHGNHKTRDHVIRRALRVSPGEHLSVDDPRFDVSRFRLLSLGHFSDVRLRLRKGGARGRVVLVVEVVERGTIVLTDLFLGTSEATAAWGGFGLAEKNFLGRGIGLEGAFVLGANPVVKGGELQQAYWLRTTVPRLAGGPLALTASFLYVNGNEFFRQSGPSSSSDPKDFLSIRYRRAGGTLGAGFDLARYTRLHFDYRGEFVRSEVPLGAVRHAADGWTVPIDFDIANGASHLSNVRVLLERDTRSDPVVPERGSLLTLTGEVSSRVLGSSYDYFKLSASYRHFFPLRWGHVFALQVFGGALFGEAPFFDKFFIADLNDLLPSRALGLNFSTLPSRNIFRTSIDEKRYEELAARLSVEYIVPWFRGGRWFYAGDFFLNAGVIFLASRAELKVRDRPLAEQIPVDLTLDAGLRLDTHFGIFRFSIGNALGRIPF